MNTKLIGTIVVVVAVVGIGFAVTKNSNKAPDVNDTGGFFEGGSLGTDSAEACQQACDALGRLIKEKKDARAKDLIEGAGCSLGSGGEWTGTMAGGYQYTCPTQSSAEALGEAVGEMKSSPNATDREIKDLEKQFEENCPCNRPQPGQFIQIAPPYIIICPDGTSLSGNPKSDAQGNAVLDANGNYIDASTGQSVVCP